MGNPERTRGGERLRYGLCVSVETYFRAGVGLIVLNDAGQVLAAERSDRPGAWQTPQGGLQPWEEPIEAAGRELFEETGIRWSEVIVIAESPQWLGYELPAEARSEKTGHGQVQKWFLVRYRGADDTVDVGKGAAAEFRTWTWMPAQELVERSWEVKRPIYRYLAETWSTLLVPAQS
jgi:putative (di)nucleoside polyphosphate hydrolase